MGAAGSGSCSKALEHGYTKGIVAIIMGLYGAIWGYMGLLGAIWGYMGL